MIENILPNKSQFDTMNSFLAIIANNSGSSEITDLKTVQNIVRSGLARKNFSVGDRITVNKKMDDGSTRQLTFEVVDFDKYTPCDSRYTHSMTLMMMECYLPFMFYSYPSAFFYAENGLSAGAYNVEMNDNHYQFTLGEDLPSGGQLLFKNTIEDSITNWTVSSYEGAYSQTPIESNIEVSVGNAGTNLGSLNYERVKFGSSDYSPSYIRKWLNSDAQDNAFWTPEDEYSHIPEDSKNGFLFGIDEDFLSVLGRVNVPTVYTNGDSVTLQDLVFLPSANEMGLSYNRSHDDNEMFELYKKLLNGNYSNDAKSARIKYSYESFGDIKRMYFTRTAQNSSFINIICISQSGKITFSAGIYESKALPCVNIV